MVSTRSWWPNPRFCCQVLLVNISFCKSRRCSCPCRMCMLLTSRPARFTARNKRCDLERRQRQPPRFFYPQISGDTISAAKPSVESLAPNSKAISKRNGRIKVKDANVEGISEQGLCNGPLAQGKRNMTSRSRLLPSDGLYSGILSGGSQRIPSFPLPGGQILRGFRMVLAKIDLGAAHKEFLKQVCVFHGASSSTRGVPKIAAASGSTASKLRGRQLRRCHVPIAYHSNGVFDTGNKGNQFRHF